MAQPDPEPKKVDRFELLRAGAAGAATQTIMSYLNQHAELPNLGQTSRSGYIDMYGQAAPGAPMPKTISKWGSWAYLRRTRAVDGRGARVYSLSERIAQGRAFFQRLRAAAAEPPFTYERIVRIGHSLGGNPDMGIQTEIRDIVHKHGVYKETPALYAAYSDDNMIALLGTADPAQNSSTYTHALRRSYNWTHALRTLIELLDLGIMSLQCKLEIASTPALVAPFVTAISYGGVFQYTEYHSIWPLLDAVFGYTWPHLFYDGTIVAPEMNGYSKNFHRMATMVPGLRAGLAFPIEELFQTHLAYYVLSSVRMGDDVSDSVVVDRINAAMAARRADVDAERAVRVRLIEWKNGVARNNKPARATIDAMLLNGHLDRIFAKFFVQPATQFFGHEGELTAADAALIEDVVKTRNDWSHFSPATINAIASNVSRIFPCVSEFHAAAYDATLTRFPNEASFLQSLYSQVYDHLAPGRWPALLAAGRLPHQVLDIHQQTVMAAWLSAPLFGDYRSVSLTHRLCDVPIELYPDGFDPLELIASPEAMQKWASLPQVREEELDRMQFAQVAHRALHPPKRMALREAESELERAERAVAAAKRRVQELMDAGKV